MGTLTYGMGVSLDGYIAGPGGDIGWSAPDEELHQYWNDEGRKSSAALYGRRLYELMSAYWPTADQEPGVAAGLVDDYRVVVLPTVVGGGTPFFPTVSRYVQLRLVEHRTFPSGAVLLHYEAVSRP